MNALTIRLVVLSVVAVLAAGCTVTKFQVRPSLTEDLQALEQDLDLMPALPRPPQESGSIWSDAGPGAAWVRDTRAYRINDLVTIVVLESTSGQNASDTDLSRESSADFGAAVAFGLEDTNPQPGEFNLNQVLSTDSSSEFKGDGTTRRSNTLNGSITTRVMRVLPNGDLVVGGQKTVTVNREKQILTLVGTIRPVDISSGNRVGSGSVGDLTVRLWGQGEVDATIRQGWFMRIMNRIWPF